MKNYWVYSAVLAATLFFSCSSLLYPSREATEKSRVTTVDLSSSPNVIYRNLGFPDDYPELYSTLSRSSVSPFCPIYTYQCLLKDTSCACLELYDLLGNLRMVWEHDKLPPGQYEFNFRDLGLEPMMFFVKLRINGQDFPKGMLLL